MKPVYFETEGTAKNGDSYESGGCRSLTPESIKFFHELLDEFFEAFQRDPNTASIQFRPCSEAEHEKR